MHKQLRDLIPVKRSGYHLLPSGKEEIQEDLGHIRDRMISRDSLCMFTVSDTGRRCKKITRTKEAQGCHTISESKVLTPLADKDGSVLDFTWSVREWERLFLTSSSSDPVHLWDIKDFEPQYAGTGQATKAGYACNYHDGKGFRRLDAVETIDPDNREIVFLAGFRTLMHATSCLRQVYWILADEDTNNRVRAYGLPADKFYWRRYRNAFLSVGKTLHGQLTTFGKLQHTYEENLEAIPVQMSIQTEQFHSNLRFAASALLDAPDAFAIVLPEPAYPTLHQLTIIQFEREEGTVGRAAQTLTSLAQSCGVNTENWIKLFSGVLGPGACAVASPDSYQDLKEVEQFQVRLALRDASKADWIEKFLRRKNTGH